MVYKTTRRRSVSRFAKETTFPSERYIKEVTFLSTKIESYTKGSGLNLGAEPVGIIVE